MIDPLTIHVLLILFLATLIRSAFGFGEALIAVPLLVLKLPLATAAPLAVLVSVTVAAVVVIQDHRHIHFNSAAGLIAASLLGIPLGLWLLTAANPSLIKGLLGTIIIAFSAWSLKAHKKNHLTSDHLPLMFTCGFLAGILGGAYGMNGPPLVVYGALRQWSAQHFRATLQAYFLPASALGLLGYALTGLWTAQVTHYYLLSLPPVAAAIFIGRWINHRLRGDAFLRIIYAGLILIGLLLITQSLSWL